jgi:uncharacterized membrane protein SirB2
MVPMENSHFMRNLLLVVAGLIVAGFVAIWVIKALLGIIFYIVVGALVVGGGMYLYARTKRAIRSGRIRRQIRRY